VSKDVILSEARGQMPWANAIVPAGARSEESP